MAMNAIAYTGQGKPEARKHYWECCCSVMLLQCCSTLACAALQCCTLALLPVAFSSALRHCDRLLFPRATGDRFDLLRLLNRRIRETTEIRLE